MRRNSGVVVTRKVLRMTFYKANGLLILRALTLLGRMRRPDSGRYKLSSVLTKFLALRFALTRFKTALEIRLPR